MRAELTAELDTTIWMNKSLPGTGFESKGGEVRNMLKATALPFRICIYFVVASYFMLRMASI
ncbi:unnamed protein product [Prunus armeniaca]